MIFVLNKGASKTVKLKSGVVFTIPSGARSLPSDEMLIKVVDTHPELSSITQDEFYKINKIVPVKDKVKKAVDDRRAEIKKDAETAEQTKKVKEEAAVDVKQPDEKSQKAPKNKNAKKSQKAKEE